MSRRVPLKVGKAGDKGLGVFASAGIPEGMVLIRYHGMPHWIWEIPKWQWEHLFQLGYDLYACPRVGSYGWSVNHSCEPNCAVYGERELVTIRRVRSGEELTFDYSTNVGWDGFLLPCRCRTRSCRGIVTSYGRLSEEWKKKYEGMVSPFLLKPPVRRRPTLF